MSNIASGWEGLIAEGEEILWQGQPNSRIDLRGLFNPQTLMGAFFTGFSLFWIAMAAQMMSGASNIPFPFRFFPLFGVPFLLMGLWMLGGRLIFEAYLRSQTYYTLTSRQAFIARNAFGKRTLESYKIRDMPRLTLEDGSPGSVIFAQSQRRTARRTQSGPVGFVQIDDPRRVYSLLDQARSDLRARARDKESKTR